MLYALLVWLASTLASFAPSDRMKSGRQLQMGIRMRMVHERRCAHIMLCTIHLSNGIFHDAKHSRCTLHTVENRRCDLRCHHFRPQFLIELNSWTSSDHSTIQMPTCCRCETADEFRCDQQHRECRANSFDSVRGMGDARTWTNKNPTKKLHAQAINISSIHVVTWQRRVCIACCKLQLALGSLGFALRSNS